MIKKLLYCMLFFPTLLWGQNVDMKKYMGILGSVADYVTHKPIPGALVEILSQDSVVIMSMKARGESHNNGKITQLANYGIPAERGKKFLLRFSHEEYETTYVAIDLTNSYKRELTRDLPPVYLLRSMTGKLDEVVVTATKLKFHYKGDTLVYNAGAFRLAEGSMLDALIKQLPGAELRTNGEIIVNGKKVNSLLLNGKDFFRGNNQIMLDNLPNYMVNTINVYDRQSKQSEFLGYNMGDDEFVMDVKLKKEYSIGWLGNVEGGMGTEDRYLGRLFALRFTNHSQLSFYGNINNINESRKPGEDGDWSPDKLQGGLLTTRMAGMNYAIDDRRKRFNIDGNMQFENTDNDLNSYTNRTNFLESGDTYDWQRNLSRRKDTRISTAHRLYLRGTNSDLDLSPQFNYHKYENSNEYSSATFANELTSFNKEQLDSVFMPNFGKSLRNLLINRNLQKGKGNGSEWNGALQTSSTIKIKYTPDAINLSASVAFKGGDSERYNQNRVDYYRGASAGSTDSRNQYWNNTPGKGYDYSLKASYVFSKVYWPTWTFSYKYGQKYDSRTSSLYRLDQLNGWGSDTEHEIGTLPSEDIYKNTLDAGNSYESRLLDRIHEADFSLNWKKQTKKHVWWSQVSLPITLQNRHLDYQQGKTDTIFSRRTVLLNLSNTFLQWKTLDNKHSIFLSYNIKSQAPEMNYFVNVKNDADPLNITMGNPNLKDSYRHQYSISYTHRNSEKQRSSQIYLMHSVTQNAIAMGYNYNKQTGVRTFKPDNINGNWNGQLSFNFSSPLDKKRKITLNNTVYGDFYHNVDLIGIDDVTTNSRSTVETFRLSDYLSIKYQLKDASFGLKANAAWSSSSSNRKYFTTINALDMNYGLTAQWNLPYKWQVNTDLTMYTRRGYEEHSMNTDDLVWNLRVSRPFFKNHILVTVDGFDVLRQLNNVNRTLNAQGRVETYTNVIPRYFLCHLTYRLNIQPKKR